MKLSKRRSAIVLLCAIGAAASSGCGYRIVKRTDVTARRFAADSASMLSLAQRIQVLSAKCRADSLRMSAAIALAATTTAVPTRVVPATVVPDSLVRARDTEIATLREQLTRANAELDRIKRRLANPRP